MAREIYKMINNLAPHFLSDLIHKNNSTYNFRKENSINLPQVKTTTYGKKKPFVSNLPGCGTVCQMISGKLRITAVSADCCTLGTADLSVGAISANHKFFVFCSSM